MFFKKNKKKSLEIPNFKMGVIKDEYDEHDYNFKALVEDINLPDKVDLRPYFPSMFSQNSQGSCTSNAGVAYLAYLFYIKYKYKLIFSRQYLYNMERINDNCPLTLDNGSSMRQICNTLKKNGCCFEEDFEYGNGNEKIAPPTQAIENAKKYTIKSYYRCDDLTEAKIALSKGFPVLLGIEVYNEFYKTGNDGKIPKININGKCYGGHAILIVGYYTVNTILGKKTIFIIRNSWGLSEKSEDSWGYAFNNPSDSGFGEDGYGYISEDNLKNIIMDMWVITEVENID